MALPTRLTETLGIEHPVMLAGMGGVSYHRLTAAVSAAGGFGCLGASVMSNDQMVEEIRRVREATDLPFGVDLLTAMPGDLVGQVELLVEGGASVFVAGLGVPAPAIELCHRHGVLVANMCGKVAHARKAVAAGCDLVIAQGTEAGGHTGQVATMTLVPLIVDAVAGAVPVVAAGGIFDGRGLAAALALGADGVWLGTRFIATPEAQGVRGYKEALVAAAEDGTVISRAYSGKTMRVLRNRFTDDWDSKPGELEPFPLQAVRSIRDGAFHLGGDESTEGVDPDIECYPAGQGVGGIDALRPAGDIVRSIVEEAVDVLRGPADREFRRAQPRGDLPLGRSSTAGPPSGADHRESR
ncbi:MAG: NAD(P)H-dependent flavin oxidoreductase [Acidimicrobiales bacterium]